MPFQSLLSAERVVLLSQAGDRDGVLDAAASLLSDASPADTQAIAESLKATGVPVARRTVAKYREAMSIPSSQDRLRIG